MGISEAVVGGGTVSCWVACVCGDVVMCVIWEAKPAPYLVGFSSDFSSL